MRKDFLVFGQPLIEEPEIAEVVDSLRASWPGTGPKVSQFEELVREYKGVKHAVAVNSCTAGLHLSCLALELQPGDEVITTPLTFCGTVNAIIHAGGTPVLADIDPETLNVNPEEICKKINARTFGDCGVLSFYSTKNVTTGEGGMILTNDDSLAAWFKLMSQQGVTTDAWQRLSAGEYRHYDVAEIGFKYNMMDLQAAIGIHQLERVERCWQRRHEIWNRYNDALRDLPVGLPSEPSRATRHALHLYTILIDKEKCGVSRDEFIVRL